MSSYRSGGGTDGPTLLLVHPMGADGRFWDACCTRWSDCFDCIAPDLRNAGTAPSSDRPITIEEHARDLAGLCDRMGLQSVIPVGCAVGSMVAGAFAGMYPQRCVALVLANPGFRTLPAARAALVARAASVRAQGMTAALPSALERAFLGCLDDERKGTYRQRLLALDPERYALQIEGMLDADLSPHLARVGCPVLLVPGGRDSLLPMEHAERLKTALPRAELVPFADGAHLIPYQQPQRFAALVMEFIARAT